MQLRRLIPGPISILRMTGISSLFVGSLYYPLFPWYLLGQVQEEEIALWGLLSMTGGTAVLVGAMALQFSTARVGQVLLLISLAGMTVLMLAQVPAMMAWLFYGGVFTKHWARSELVGMTVGLLLHTWICLSAAAAMLAAGRALRGGLQPELRLSRRGWLSFAAVLLLLLGGLWGWEQCQSRHWLASVYPANGAAHVPRNATVSASWHGQYDSMGLRIAYADAPDEPMPGVTAGTPYGISFTPEKPFLPGRKITVTVEAGRRSHSFTFTTALE